MTFTSGYFMANAFPVGYYPENYFTEYGLAAPPQSASRLRQIIAKMESQNIGTYCFEPGCVEPGCDNHDTMLRRIIAKMEA